jgi:glutaredoxin 3
MSRLMEFSTTFKPFHYSWAMEISVNHELLHWHELEAELQGDVLQWNTGVLVPHEVNQVTQILRLFTQTDAQVAGNYCDLFIPYFRNNEIRCMLLAFAAREGIHQRAYALLNDTLGLPDEDYSAFLDYTEMSDKIEFMQDNDTSTLPGMAKALAQSVCNEGVSLFSAFVMLLNYQRFGKMVGMCKIVEWSIRDETQHVDGMSRLFREYCNENPEVLTDTFKASVYEMFRLAIELEDKFIDLAFEMGAPKGLTKEEVKQYIRYIADRRLIQMGFKSNFDVRENPLPWVAELLAEGHTNFFEQRVSEYSVVGMVDDWGWEEHTASPSNN